MAVQRSFAPEDGNLTTSAVVTSRTSSYKDIDLTFEKRPSGDVYKKNDAAAVKQAVKSLLLTNNFEKPFRPSYGGNLQGLLFELASDPVQAADIKENIIEQINTFEPRAQTTNVQVILNPDQNAISVQVYFRIISTNEEVNIETVISRLR